MSEALNHGSLSSQEQLESQDGFVAGDVGFEATESYMYLLCYVRLESAEMLAKHCRSDPHTALVRLDCGSELVWKHHPPPPGIGLEDFSLCDKSVV